MKTLAKIFIRHFPFFILLGFFLTGSPVRAANILIINGPAYPGATTTLNADLIGTNTITTSNGIPASLAGFTQIYDLNIDVGLTAGQINQYLAFLNAAPNNSLFLAGENAGFIARNNAIAQLITLAGGGSIGAVTTSFGTETVATQFQTPNSVTTVPWQACGKVATTGTGAFATTAAGGGCALFFGLGALANAPTGALMVVNDINFILGPVSANEIAFRKNMENILAAPPLASPQKSVPVPTLSEWAQIAIAILLAFFGWRQIRRRYSPSVSL